MNNSTKVILDRVTIGGNLNLYLKTIDGIDGLRQINHYSLNSDSVKRIYADFIECFIEAEGYFSKKVQQTIEEIDIFLINESREKNIDFIFNIDGIESALADIKEFYCFNDKKIAYVNYLQGCLLQVKFDFSRGYDFIKESCLIEKDIRYYSAAGELALKLSKYCEAEDYFRNSIDIFHSYKYTDNNIFYIEILNNLGGALDQQHKFKQAVSSYKEAIRLLKNNIADNRESRLYFGLLYNNIGGALLALEDISDAKKYLQQSLELREYNFASASEIAVTKNNLAEVSRFQRDMPQAEKLLNQALLSIENTYKKHPNHPVLAMTLNNLGNLYFDLHEYDKAEVYFKKSLNIVNYLFKNSGCVESIITLYNLASTCWIACNYKDSLSFFEKSLSEAEKNLDENDPILHEVKKKYKLFINRRKFSVENLIAKIIK